ncbi:hypothetical protein PLIIFM63780_005321 [Purpureocillium lilacinum]|uniref:uncharacterized protein n=1 Tax=Purpureocillium lilacinum TaxID=33203 RepID=UPI0020875899|nr:hypothetical protein PLICBS_006420 [Purpureocillium lilacinum]GJN81785.1 hypothetical protein PLIIFM63780_005321 [Purpureocillium lilacinum]
MLLSEAVKDDHDMVVEIYHRVVAATEDADGPAARETFMTRVGQCVVKEKLVLLPFIRQVLPDDGERLERYRLDHISIKEKLHRLHEIPMGDVSFVPELTSLWIDLSGHIADLDDRDLPALEDATSADESEAAAVQYCEAGAYEPEMAHPPSLVAESTKLVDDFLGRSQGHAV